MHREIQHSFSSGEILYQQNIRELEEGKLTADHILYDKISENTEFTCIGSINGKKAEVRFHLADSGRDRVMLRKNMNILMQSDIFQAEWDHYEIIWLDSQK